MKNSMPFIIMSLNGDVTGNGVPDKVYITGEKKEDSPYITNVTLHVKNGRTGKTISVKPSINEGYNPTIFLGDFTGNKVLDCLLQMDSGGSGATTYDYIYSFEGNRSRLIFDFEKYNNEFLYKIIYMNYFGVEAISFENKNKYIIDLAYRDEEYLRQIYNEDGTLKQPIEGFVNPLSALFPIDLERDRIYELMAFQKIAGLYNADALGYFQNILKWDGDKFILFEQYLGIFGSEIT